MTIPAPGYDEVILTAPDSPRACISLACSRAGKPAEVIVTYGVLNDPDTSFNSRGALWRESWGIPMCETCWEASRQVAVRYRPGLIIRDYTALAAPQPARGRA